MPLLPKNDLGHLVGRLVHKRLPQPLAQKSVRFFAKAYKINLDEAEFPIDHYQSIGELFVRRLKPEARPLGEGLLHPADSRVTECGKIQSGQLLQAKGQTYSVVEFLRNPRWAEAFDGGDFITYYLCPTDYHRVHSPADADLVASVHVPGEMWPVNEWSVENVVDLFNVNERVVMLLQTPRGKIALVMVAATNVGNMSFSFDENIMTNVKDGERQVREHSYQPGISIKRGEELGVFHMGSTVIVLFEKGILSQDVALLRGQQVKVRSTLEVTGA